MKADDLLLHLEAYIALESALGFSLRARERLLRNFVAFVQGSGTMGPITAQIALDWACLASDHCGTSGKAARLSIARRFLFHLSAVVPGTEIPNATLLVRPRRQKPFLFSAEEISRRSLEPYIEGRLAGSQSPTARNSPDQVSQIAIGPNSRNCS
jgi:hypothetical protein